MSHYFFHDLLGLKHDVSLELIEHIGSEFIHHFLDKFPECEPVDWQFSKTPTDILLANTCYFDINDFSRNESIQFNFEYEHTYFEQYIYDKYPALTPFITNFSYCSAVYANLHDDSLVATSRGQLMYILDNPDQHSFLSVNDDKNIMITPMAGDVLFLDIHKPHALIPNTSISTKYLDKRPMKIALVALD